MTAAITPAPPLSRISRGSPHAIVRLGTWCVCLLLAACGGGGGGAAPGVGNPVQGPPPPAGGGNPPAAVVTADQMLFEVTATTSDPAPTVSTMLRLENGPDDGAYIFYDFTENAV